MHKFLAFDLDGTLLTSNKIIDMATKQLICHLNGVGGKCVILISGRHFREMKSFIESLQLPGECYFISSDGQYVYGKDYNILYTAPFVIKSDIFSFLSQHNHRNALIVTDSCDYQIEPYLGRFVFKMVRKYVKRLNVSILREKAVWEEAIDNIEKVAVYGLTNEHTDERFCMHEYVDGRVELFNCNVNKYFALKFLHDRHLVNLDDILYFGDDMNDYMCFCKIQDTVAMGNASDEIKKLSRYVTGDCDHKGVLEALYKIEMNAEEGIL